MQCMRTVNVSVGSPSSHMKNLDQGSGVSNSTMVLLYQKGLLGTVLRSSDSEVGMAMRTSEYYRRKTT